jgi:transposase-like protein
VGGQRRKTEKWLSKQDVYTIHRPARKIYPRNRVEVYGIDSQWQADLVDMQSLAKHNDGFNYLLMVIDVFSKYGWARPLKSKGSHHVADAFRSILRDSGRKPLKLQTDKGTEFTNAEFQALLKRNDIHFFTLNSELKACVVERWNRTIKERMWRYFTHKNTFRYIEILQSIIDSYNSSWHSSIHTSPASVTLENEDEIRKILYPQLSVAGKYKFSVGNHVRVSKNKLRFEKGYVGNWSEEIFEIEAVKKRHHPVYKLKDLQGTSIDGVFYEPELQRVRKKITNDLFVIEKVLKTEGRGRRKRHFVKWRGYPSSFNSWVSASEVEKI